MNNSTIKAKFRILTFMACLVGFCCRGICQELPQKTWEAHGVLVGNDGTAIPFEPITAYTRNDSVVIAQITTDSLGQFTLRNLCLGEVFLSAVSDSGKPLMIFKFTVVDTHQGQFSLGTIIFPDKRHLLNEVSVKGQKPLYERELDRLIVNVSSSPTSLGKTALELLGNIPGLRVDNDGNLKLQNQGEILLLIDGRGERLASRVAREQLKRLNSESIDKVEIYYNPPAKYEAQGAGVINVITKKDKSFSDAYVRYRQQFFSNGRDPEFDLSGVTAGANLNVLIGKLKLSSMISMTTDNATYQEGVSERFFLTRGSRAIDQNAFQTKSIIAYAQMAASYSIGKRTEISTTVSYADQPKNLGFSDRIRNFYSSETTADSSNLLIAKTRIIYKNPQFNVLLSHIIDPQKKHSFEVSLTQGGYRTRQQGIYHREAIGIDSRIGVARQNENYKVTLTAAKIDFRSVVKNYTIEYGAKHTRLHNSDNINGEAGENNFKYRENITAGYTSVATKKGKVSLQVGLRGEMTVSKAFSSLIEGGMFKRRYFDVFPSLFVQVDMRKDARVGFSANRRIVRPQYKDFNPFLYTTPSDGQLLRHGNAYLSPQYNYKMEINLLHKQIYYYISHVISNNVRSYTAEDNGNNMVSQETINTASNETSFGVSLPVKVMSCWRIQSNFSGNYFVSKLPDSERRDIWFIDAAVMQNFSISQKLGLEMTFRYTSKTISAFTTTSDLYALDIGLRYSLGKNTAITFNCTDLLGTYRWQFSSIYENMRESTNQTNNARQLRIGLSYKFITGRAFAKKNTRINDFGEIRY